MPLRAGKLLKSAEQLPQCAEHLPVWHEEMCLACQYAWPVGVAIMLFQFLCRTSSHGLAARRISPVCLPSLCVQIVPQPVCLQCWLSFGLPSLLHQPCLPSFLLQLLCAGLLLSLLPQLACKSCLPSLFAQLASCLVCPRWAIEG